MRQGGKFLAIYDLFANFGNNKSCAFQLLCTKDSYFEYEKWELVCRSWL